MKDKKFKDLTLDELQEVKIEFAPGCFDNFEGTQDELNAMIADIERMVKSGELQEKSEPLNIDDLDEDELVKLAHKLLDDETLEELIAQGMPAIDTRRNLQ